MLRLQSMTLTEMNDIITIERHILEQQRRFPEATGAFASLLYDMALIAKMIARKTSRAGLNNMLGRSGTVNVQGEDQQKLDLFAHNTIVQLMNHTGRLSLMGSEESAEPIEIPASLPRGGYVLLFDPLDGSSNIDSNAPVGTIFSIYRNLFPDASHATLDDLLQPGSEQVAAGYVLYGSSTILVYTAGYGVHSFTFDPWLGEFLLSHENIRFPEQPKYYCINQGYTRYWSSGVKLYIDQLMALDDEHKSPLSQRYLGSLVADFHCILMSGGIFLYPADSRDPDLPFGKLRLCYECAPMAFITEQAGGYASDGLQPISCIQPRSLHQRIPFFAGNRNLVSLIERSLAQHDGQWLDAYRAHPAVGADV
jgi:fructose-1,6-bisphosphatase I